MKFSKCKSGRGAKLRPQLIQRYKYSMCEIAIWALVKKGPKNGITCAKSVSHEWFFQCSRVGLVQNWVYKTHIKYYFYCAKVFRLKFYLRKRTFAEFGLSLIKLMKYSIWRNWGHMTQMNKANSIIDLLSWNSVIAKT